MTAWYGNLVEASFCVSRISGLWNNFSDLISWAACWTCSWLKRHEIMLVIVSVMGNFSLWYASNADSVVHLHVFRPKWCVQKDSCLQHNRSDFHSRTWFSRQEEPCNLVLFVPVVSAFNKKFPAVFDALKSKSLYILLRHSFQPKWKVKCCPPPPPPKGLKPPLAPPPPWPSCSSGSSPRSYLPFFSGSLRICKPQQS